MDTFPCFVLEVACASSKDPHHPRIQGYNGEQDYGTVLKRPAQLAAFRSKEMHCMHCSTAPQPSGACMASQCRTQAQRAPARDVSAQLPLADIHSCIVMHTVPCTLLPCGRSCDASPYVSVQNAELTVHRGRASWAGPP